MEKSFLSGFGCKAFAPAMIGVLDEAGVSKTSKSYKAFRFGLSSAPMMFVSFHAACCIVLLLMQAALRAGLDVNAANDTFLLPVAASLLPFVLWCFLCDIPVTVAFVVLAAKGWLKLPKAAIIFCPLDNESAGEGHRSDPACSKQQICFSDCLRGILGLCIHVSGVLCCCIQKRIRR